MHQIKIISGFCPRDRIFVCDKLSNIPKYFFSQKRVPVVRVFVEVEGLFFVEHYYLWGSWIERKFCIHDVIIELGNHLMNKYFGVNMFTLMKRRDIRNLHDITWVQEKSEPVVVFCWCFNLKQQPKDIGELLLYLRPHIGMYLK